MGDDKDSPYLFVYAETGRVVNIWLVRFITKSQTQTDQEIDVDDLDRERSRSQIPHKSEKPQTVVSDKDKKRL